MSQDVSQQQSPSNLPLPAGRSRGRSRGRGSRGGMVRGARNPVGRPRKDQHQDMSKLATHRSHALPRSSREEGITLTPDLQQTSFPTVRAEDREHAVVDHSSRATYGYEIKRTQVGTESGVSMTTAKVSGPLGEPHEAITFAVVEPAATGGSDCNSSNHPQGVVVAGNPLHLAEAKVDQLCSSGQLHESKIMGSTHGEFKNSFISLPMSDSIPPPPPLKSIQNMSLGPSTSNDAHSEFTSSTASETTSTARTFRKRGPKRKHPNANAVTGTNDSESSDLSIQPLSAIKRRRGRPKGSGIHLEGVVSRRGGRGRGSRRGRIGSNVRLANVLPCPDPIDKVNTPTVSLSAAVPSVFPGSGVQSAGEQARGGAALHNQASYAGNSSQGTAADLFNSSNRKVFFPKSYFVFSVITY